MECVERVECGCGVWVWSARGRDTEDGEDCVSRGLTNHFRTQFWRGNLCMQCMSYHGS